VAAFSILKYNKYRYLINQKIMTKVKKIDVMSAAKVEGLIGVIIGLVMGIIFALFGAIASSFIGDRGSMGVMIGSGFGAIIIMPIMYGVGGFIGGAISALIYNLVSGWIGGLEIELENK
jgi:hypothetical protein